MTELDLVRDKRSDETVELLAKRIEPTIGFVVYSVVFLFVSSFPALVGGVIGAFVMHAVGFDKAAVATQVVSLVVALVFWIVAWIPYVRWARRKRNAARAIVRDGVLCDAFVVTSTSDRLAQLAVRLAINAAGGAGLAQTWERIVFEHDRIPYVGVAPFDEKPDAEAHASVLFLPAAPYALAFAPNGKAFVIKVHRHE